MNTSASPTVVTTDTVILTYTLSAQQEFISTVLVEQTFKIIITVIGLVGNALTIVLLSSKHNRKSSTAVYLNALAISDIVILIFGPFCDWLEVMCEVTISKYGTFACKLQTFMQYSSSSTSSWLLVAVTIERVISVTIPHRVRSSCTTRLALIIVVVTWTIVYAANTHFLFGMGHTFNKLCKAVSSEQYIKFNTFILPWVDFCLCFACPGTLILIGNTLIIYKLTQYHARHKHMTNGRTTSSRSVSLILVVVNFVFIITSGPIYIFSIMFPYLKKSLSPQEVMTMRSFWGPLLNSIWESNAALNIVLYVLSGSRFRRELFHLLVCKKCPSPNTNGVFESKLYGKPIYSRSLIALNRCNSNSVPFNNNLHLLNSAC